MIPDELERALEGLAQRSPLLVGVDFDGTLAPIVEVPEEARPAVGGVEALAELAADPLVTVALVSGRSIANLAACSGSPAGVLLVGGHGSEWPDEEGAAAPEELGRLVAALEAIAAAAEGAWVEVKPHSAVLHLRRVDPARWEELARRVWEGPGSWPGVRCQQGKAVVEVSLSDATKGTALDRLRQQAGAVAVLYVGDDVTDEDAFAVLAPPDVAVKVGEGETLAPYRVSGAEQVVAMLRRLAELRR